VWQNDFVVGDFIWTAIDYIGESAIGGNGYNAPSDLQACGGYCPQGWSWHISFCGDIDIAGLKKPQAYYRNVLWNVSTLELAVHAPVPRGNSEAVASWGWPDERQSWTWPTVNSSTSLGVNVYTRHAAVQLFVNGKAVQPATSPVSYSTKFTATFDVPYATGELTAVGYNGHGTEVERKTLTTAGVPAAIVLTPDRGHIDASRSDLSFVSATIVDSKGVGVPTAALDVTFEVSGAGELAAVSSGDPTDPNSFFTGTRTTYRGVAIAIVRPGTGSGAVPTSGTINIKAMAPGLTPVTTTVSF
jgi:beta-galactosidase